MKKNTLSLILVLVLGLSLFSVATVAAGTTNEGYEKFKDYFDGYEKDQKDHGEVIMQMTVVDNGNEIVSVNGQFIGNKTEDVASGTMSAVIDGETVALDFYKTPEAMYMLDQIQGGSYKVIGKDNEDDETSYDEYHKRKGPMTAVEEELLDYLVGDLKDNFTAVEKTDGSVTFSFEMAEEEVPALVNLMVKAGSAANHRGYNSKSDELQKYPFLSNVDPDVMPDLVEGVKIQQMAMTVSFDALKNLEAFSFELGFSGKDADGIFHEVAVQTSGTLMANDQTVTPLDISSYDWEIIEHDYEKQGHERRFCQ